MIPPPWEATGIWQPDPTTPTRIASGDGQMSPPALTMPVYNLAPPGRRHKGDLDLTLVFRNNRLSCGFGSKRTFLDARPSP